MTDTYLVLLAVSGLLLAGTCISQTLRIRRINRRLERMQHDIGSLERQVQSLRTDSHVHHGSSRRYL